MSFISHINAHWGHLLQMKNWIAKQTTWLSQLTLTRLHHWPPTRDNMGTWLEGPRWQRWGLCVGSTAGTPIYWNRSNCPCLQMLKPAATQTHQKPLIWHDSLKRSTSWFVANQTSWALAFWNGQWFIRKGIDTYSRYGFTFPATEAQPALLTGGLWNAWSVGMESHILYIQPGDLLLSEEGAGLSLWPWDPQLTSYTALPCTSQHQWVLQQLSKGCASSEATLLKGWCANLGDIV